MNINSNSVCHYVCVFVVLVYRNTRDLQEFFESNHIPNSHTIVVISHYDDDSDNEFQRIASENNADSILIPNRGYGYGNNKGVEFAIANYQFDYLVISNADITIRCLNTKILNRYNDYIVAPMIIAANGKKQNPNEPYKPSDLAYKLMYKTYSHNMTNVIWIFHGLAKLRRIYYNSIGKFFSGNEIYSAHGSFVILPFVVLKKLIPIYNEKIFLMNEESHLAMKARHLGIKTVYVKDIIIDHKEDGSMSLEYKNEFPLQKQSFMVFYDYWYKGER